MKNLNEIQEQLTSLSNLVEDAVLDNERVDQLTDILACHKHEVVSKVEEMKVNPCNVENIVNNTPTLDVIKDIIKKAYQHIENDALILDGDPRLCVDNYDDEATITIEKDEYYPDYEDLADMVHDNMLAERLTKQQEEEEAKAEAELNEGEIKPVTTSEDLNEGMGTNETEIKVVVDKSTEGAE